MAADLETRDDLALPADDGRALGERGRYAITVFADGAWAIATAGPLCETCSNCGCGQAYREPVPVPAMVVGMITGQSSLPAPLAKMLARVMPGG